ncbi:hypothetical protein AURDEDRAFT_131916, partial [Auricularia subglabra TFB-10046 SS5]
MAMAQHAASLLAVSTRTNALVQVHGCAQLHAKLAALLLQLLHLLLRFLLRYQASRRRGDPVQTAILRQHFQRCFKTDTQMKNPDQRAHGMTEIPGNSKSKLYEWEPAFIRRTLHIHNHIYNARELVMLHRTGVLNVLSGALRRAHRHRPHGDTIFPAIALCMWLQFPHAMLSMIMSSSVEALVSVHQLKSFLRAGEPQALRRLMRSDHGGEFAWDGGQGRAPTLESSDPKVCPGQLVGILSRVGARSLLSAIVGEMAPCALRPNLETLPDGDQTMVGKKGIKFSGDRARIARARTVYARADLYSLDDVPPAGDSHVVRHASGHVIGPRNILADKFDGREIILERATYAQAMLDKACELHGLMSVIVFYIGSGPANIWVAW